MTRYRVSCRVRGYAHYEVDAETPEDAKEKAQALAENDEPEVDVTWWENFDPPVEIDD